MSQFSGSKVMDESSVTGNVTGNAFRLDSVSRLSLTTVIGGSLTLSNVALQLTDKGKTQEEADRHTDWKDSGATIAVTSDVTLLDNVNSKWGRFVLTFGSGSGPVQIFVTGK